MASTYPNQEDVFPGAPYTDGSEYILAAYANFWISAISAIEATIGAGAGAVSANPLYSQGYNVTYSTITARLADTESRVVAVPKIDSSAGDIQSVGTAAAAGGTGKTADAGHVHVGVTSISVSSPLAASRSNGAVTISTTGIMLTSVYDSAAVGGQLVNTSSAQTVINKRNTRRYINVTQAAQPAINTDTCDYAVISGLAQAITSLTNNLSGTPVLWDLLMLIITDNGTAQSLTYGAKFVSTTVALPSTTVGGVRLRVGLQWDGSAWDCIGVA